MKTSIELQGDALIAKLEGRLDTAAAPKTEQELKPLHDCQGKNIVLDCSQLDCISSSGLRIFLGVLKAAKPKGSHVYIQGLNADLQSVFAMTGFTNLFEFK